MATVKGPFQINGGVQEYSYYSMKGSDKVFMRTKGGPSKERMKEGPEFELVRRHQSEWAACVLFSRYLNRATSAFKKMGDFNVSPVWNGLGKKLINLDTDHILGERWLELSKYPQALEGFNLNRNFAFNSVFRAYIQFELNKEEQSLNIKLPRINTQNDLYNVRKMPYFRLKFSLGLISDIYFDEEKRKFKPYQFFSESYPALAVMSETDWLSTNDLISEQSFDLMLETKIPTDVMSHFSYLVCAGIEFGSVGFAGQIEPVKNASSSKIVLAEKAE